MTYKIINSGSDGNCVIIDDIIAIDMGVSYKKLAPYVKSLEIVLLSHQHSDHFKKKTIERLAIERPMLRFGCCEWLLEPLLQLGVDRKRIDVFEIGKKYNYGSFQVVPIKLYHDIPNCGYRLFKDNEKLIYCTDTYTLEGIKAIDYDYYLIEGNYENVKELEERGKDNFYIERVKHTHLSREYASNWLLDNMGLKSVYEFMHMHKEREEKDVNRESNGSIYSD